MTEWTLLKRLLDAVHQHSTMIGRLWLTVMVIFRLLIVAVATEDVYADEQDMFVCNTLQPGCSTVCYDAFSPISHPRFWVFHIVSVSTPSLCFIIYTWHKLSKQPQRQQVDIPKQEGWKAEQDSRQEAYDPNCDLDSCSVHSYNHLSHSLADVTEDVTAQSFQRGKPSSTVFLSQAQACTFGVGRAVVSGGVLSKCYIFHVCLRAVLEIGFVLAQWKLFGFQVPIHFLCTSSPCSQPVDCYISRPTEKTIFLIFMFCVGVFCILLNLLELNHLGCKKIHQTLKLRQKKSWRDCPGTKRGYASFPSDGPCLMPSFDFSEVTSTASLRTLELVGRDQSAWTCAGNPGGMKEPLEVRETVPGQAGKHDSHKRERTPLNCKKQIGGSKKKSAEVWI